MREIPLANGKGVALVDDEWYLVLSRYKWHLTCKGYAERSVIAGAGIMMHRVINMTPSQLQVDHINGNKLDNRACNLRACTTSENCKSRMHRRGANPYKGVRQLPSGKWQATIGVNLKCLYLGSYETAELAAEAYNKAALDHHGDYAKLNEIQKVAA
jgi:hypothetical protein